MFVRFFLCFDRLKTSKTALICMLKSGEDAVFRGHFRGFFPVFPRIFPDCLAQNGKSI